jgi:dipeptidyl aminopeptidase/acylaminoacyl peptidase
MHVADQSPTHQDRRTRVRGYVGRAARDCLWIGAIILILRLTGCMESLFYQPTVAPTPVPAGLDGAELVEFASRDGARLCGWFIRAQGAGPNGAAKAATILHVHGNAGNMNDHAWFTEYLPVAGFNVFIFDFRGYGQSEGRPWTRNGLLDDTHAALDYLAARSDVDRGRIGMYGQSLGGSIGLNVMAERGEIRAAVIESAFTSWREEAAAAVSGEPPAWWARALAWMLISDRARPDQAIARCAPRPILIVHGTDDGTVPIEHGRRLRAAGGANVELVEVSGGDHNSLRETNPEIEQRIIWFFRSHLGE